LEPLWAALLAIVVMLFNVIVSRIDSRMSAEGISLLFSATYN